MGGESPDLLKEVRRIKAKGGENFQKSVLTALFNAGLREIQIRKEERKCLNEGHYGLFHSSVLAYL